MLEKAPVRPPFPMSEYNASNKRTYAPDGCWDYYGGGASATFSSILGQMTLFPFYIRYDVPASALEMKGTYAANSYGQSGNSNTSVWGLYRVGSSLYDSVLVDSVTVVDTSSYTNPSKTQTMSSAYPKGWYIASIVFTAATGAGTVSSSFAKNEPVFGSLTNGTIGNSSMGHVGVTGQTSGLPSNLNSVTLASISYHSPVSLRY